MLPEMAVAKIPYESSLAPKQTVDGVICIHPMAGKKKSVDFEWISWFFFKQKMGWQVRWLYACCWEREEDKQTYSAERQRGIKRNFWMGLDSLIDNQNLFSFKVFHGVKAFYIPLIISQLLPSYPFGQRHLYPLSVNPVWQVPSCWQGVCPQVF